MTRRLLLALQSEEDYGTAHRSARLRRPEFRRCAGRLRTVCAVVAAAATCSRTLTSQWGTTGISAAEAVGGTVSGKAEYYTVDGRRTDGLHRGTNIVRVGGKTKKVFVR